MYPQKVLQGVPNLERTFNLFILDLLVMTQRNPQIIRHNLLSHALGFSGGLQVFSHPLHLPAARYGRLLFSVCCPGICPRPVNENQNYEKLYRNDGLSYDWNCRQPYFRSKLLHAAVQGFLPHSFRLQMPQFSGTQTRISPSPLR